MIPVTGYTDFLKSFTDAEHTPFPEMKDGHLRADFRALFAAALGAEPSLQNRNIYHESVVDREWERFTRDEKDLIFHGVLMQLKNGAVMTEWMVSLLMRNGGHEIHAQVLTQISTKSSTQYGYANGQLISFMTLVAELPAGSELLDVALTNLVTGDILTGAEIFKHGNFNTDDVVSLLVKLRPLQPGRPGDYNTVVERFIHGMVAHGLNELTICRLSHAGIPFDPIACLEKMARAREESWPMVLRLINQLTKVEERRDNTINHSGYHQKRQERVLWDPEWRNPKLAGDVTTAFMGWMEKKKNRIPRPIFSGNFLQHLAEIPDISTLVPGFHARAIVLWSKNVDASDLIGAARTLAMLWTGLSLEEKTSSLSLLEQKLQEEEVTTKGRPSLTFEGLKSDIFTVFRLLDSCDVPDKWFDSFIERIGIAVNKGQIYPSHLDGMSTLSRTAAGNVAVSNWVVTLLQNQHDMDIHSFTSTATGASVTSSALTWLRVLAAPSNEPVLQALHKNDRLTDVMTIATMSFLTDKSVAYNPKNDALRSYANLLNVLGNTDFLEKFDAAYEVDTGRHGFASLLAALSPNKGRGVWSTAEALYMEDIVAGTLVARPEIRAMIHDLVGEVFDPSMRIQDSAVELPDIFN
jgi:hypothetical protein